ncbi:sugar phosphate isomerase/epimerase family protein [Leifsonia sp. NPDC058194]|uniref:sugar phosphate isomerase/epimerase family protein n=1 Tax=Leifsonia sp. NPDC058194 TaxID=3346374 RepID=UPI0036DE869E
MAERRRIKFGIDLITLYDAQTWGLDDYNRFYDRNSVSPDVFWDRALDMVADAGLDGIELTFGPGHWRNALARYGSASGFRSALAERGLEVCSGFYAGLVVEGDWRELERRNAFLAEVDAYAEFLGQAGCENLIVGLPLRTTWDATPPLFVDAEYAMGLAALINEMGYLAAKRGVRLSIHPETHAVLWFRRDIDLFLSLTDPVYVGFCPDTAHITTAGNNPSEIVRQHAERITITHWKDATGRVPVQMVLDENMFKAHHPYFARAGAGIVDWQEWARTLRHVGFEGWAILELDAAADPIGAISEATAFVESTLLPIYS